MLRELECAPSDGQGLPAGLHEADGRLAEAVVRDMRALLSAIFSRLARRERSGVHSRRTRNVLTCFGWVAFQAAYVRKAGASAVARALGAAVGGTAAARERTIRCATLCGSFAEGREMLARLTGIALSISRLRKTTLEYGEQCLRAQEAAAPDVRAYAPGTLKEGQTEAPRTLFCMLDGTGVPCTKADTAGVKGKQGEAGTRQIRVVLFGEYARLDKRGRPSCFEGSFSYAVSGASIADVTGLVRTLGMARGYATVARMQCVADGEEALERALRTAFPEAVFTNDFYHACEHLHACCAALGLPAEAMEKEYRFSKGLLYRSGAAAVVRRIQTRHATALAAHPEAADELEYIRKRQLNMNYGFLRKRGFFIASGHVEAAGRIIVVRRCKQAGMHWRHANALRVSAILAHFRSAA